MTFDKIIPYLLEDEGGYVNDPKDPGGETNFGISKRSHPDVDILHLTQEKAMGIYRQEYWVKFEISAIPAHLRYMYFDMVVNMGIRNTNKLVQRLLKTKQDGILTQQQILHLKNIALTSLAEIRVLYYIGIVNKNPSQAKYLEGWKKRTARCSLNSLKLLTEKDLNRNS
jgi:lysozyme family protein